jgi:hypothetical protein
MIPTATPMKPDTNTETVANNGKTRKKMMTTGMITSINRSPIKAGHGISHQRWVAAPFRFFSASSLTKRLAVAKPIPLFPPVKE